MLRTESQVSIDHNPKPKRVAKRTISKDFSEAAARITLLHFPQRPVSIYRDVEFVLQKNGAIGQLEVKVLAPSGTLTEIGLRIIDFDRLAVRFGVTELGHHYVQVKLNGMHIPNSPFPIEVMEKAEGHQPEYFSYASLVKPIGMALKRIVRNSWNEFRVDATNAGAFTLLVGIHGPSGNVEELYLRHLANHFYVVSFFPIHEGPYIISIKWGDEDVPGSPYYVRTRDG